MYLRFRRLFEYDDESNAKAISAIRSAQPGPEQERAIGIMAHVLVARREWLRRIGGAEAVGNSAQAKDVFPTGFGINDLERLLSEVRAWWQDWLANLSEAKLRQAYDYASIDGKRWTTHIEDSLTHVLLHGAYHRGQIAMLVKSGGGEVVPTDFIINARKPVV
ncbi:MAG: DinB family protein [Phycisphaeraceae bacterium]|nr:DinB family protein [Phycisphaeraceae bacterium]MBX3368496.1 DinB family protein [Phycisphaeraceae bacterium]QYK47611.1 MAG: DinB family protein [Phycisphaeraceae bacterium]